MFITRNEVEQWFSNSFLNELFDPPKYRVEQIAREFLCATGHRWRPWLCIGVYEALSASSSKDMVRLAIAVECFHKASLIHDDIEDDDKPKALHRAVGLPQALNAGDYLIHKGYQLVSTVQHRFDDLFLREIVASQLALCRGQGEELATGKNEFAFLKTCPMFALAFSLGCLGAEEFNSGLGFANQLGIAYQLQDDLTDGASTDSDLQELVDITRKSVAQFPNAHLREFLTLYLDEMFKDRCPSLSKSS